MAARGAGNRGPCSAAERDSRRGASTASGSFQVTDFAPTAPPSQTGGACFIDATATFTFTGTLEGSLPFHFIIREAGPCDQPGPESFTATGTFTGTVAGASGTFDSTFQGHIDAQDNAQGQLAVLSGTGGLSDLHGHLTLTGQAGCGGT